MKKLFVLIQLLFVAQSAHAGFICNGTQLFSSGAPGNLATFTWAADCQNAVNSSRNGFICHGTKLFNSTAPGNLATFTWTAGCQDAVDNSTP